LTLKRNLLFCFYRAKRQDSAFEVRYGIPAVFVSNPAEAAKRLTWWAFLLGP
jgi:hypothetical protein